MQEAMTRPRREGYNAVIDTAKGILRTVRANKERLQDYCNYSGLEATAEFLLDVLDQLHGAARHFCWCAGGVHGIQSAHLRRNNLRHILAAQYVRLVVQRPAERRRTGRSIPGQPEDHGYNPPDQHKGMERRTNAGCYAADGRLQNPPGGIRRRHGNWREAAGGHAGRKFRRYGIERRKGGGVQGKAPRLRQSKV